MRIDCMDISWKLQRGCEIGSSRLDGLYSREILSNASYLFLATLLPHQFKLHRDLHKIPELGFEEKKTSQYVRYVLAMLLSRPHVLRALTHLYISSNIHHSTAGTS
jgi:hypothetical protein